MGPGEVAAEGSGEPGRRPSGVVGWEAAPMDALRRGEGVEAAVMRAVEWSGVPGWSVWVEGARSVSEGSSGVGGVGRAAADSR